MLCCVCHIFTHLFIVHAEVIITSQPTHSEIVNDLQSAKGIHRNVTLSIDLEILYLWVTCSFYPKLALHMIRNQLFPCHSAGVIQQVGSFITAAGLHGFFHMYSAACLFILWWKCPSFISAVSPLLLLCILGVGHFCDCKAFFEWHTYTVVSWTWHLQTLTLLKLNFFFFLSERIL